MVKQSILKSALILTICGIICRLLGAFYRVPQAVMLGASGMGNYYLIFPVFAFLISLSSSSIPQSLSKLVSESIAKNNKKQAKRYFVSSLFLLSIFGLICTIVLVFIAPFLSNLQGNKSLVSGYFAIAPAIFFVCLISCFRGYFQGYQTMTYSGISQIIEQVIKISLGLFLINKLIIYGVEYAVFGSLIAITISEIFALIYLFFSYIFFKNKLKIGEENDVLTMKESCKKIIKIALPFTLSYIIFPLALMIDSLFFVKILTNAGVSGEIANNVFGINSGVVSTLTNLPIVISTGLATAIVPAISGNIKSGQIKVAEEKIMLVLKIGFLILLPCAVLFAVFPREIIFILFGSLGNSLFDEMQVASGMLIISSVGVLYLGIFQITTAILQADNKFFAPIKALIIGVLIRVLVCVCLIFVSSINIYSISIASVVCYGFVAIYNMGVLQKDFPLKVNYNTFFIVPFFAIILMLCACTLFKILFTTFLPLGLSYLFALFCGGCVYILFLFVFKAFEKREVAYLFKI